MTSTRYFNFAAGLQNSPEMPMLVLFAMLANDLSLLQFLKRTLDAHEGLSQLDSIKSGGGNYLFRLFCSHVREGLKLVEPFSKTDLKDAIMRDDIEAQSSMDRLLELAPKGARSADFKLICRIRDFGTFHYFNKEMEKLIRMSLPLQNFESRLASFDYSESLGVCRYPFADDLMPDLLVNHIFEVDSLADKEREFERVSAIIYGASRDLQILCGCVLQYLMASRPFSKSSGG